MTEHSRTVRFLSVLYTENMRLFLILLRIRYLNFGTDTNIMFVTFTCLNTFFFFKQNYLFN